MLLLLVWLCCVVSLLSRKKDDSFTRFRYEWHHGDASLRETAGSVELQPVCWNFVPISSSRTDKSKLVNR